ncbi:LLM class flavin-dependent oxidoreductase [Streptomyces sp. STR69]|uniref:LLM class flavin-dependent oxidoreductase n=1 Tax=Streptomyces sp. STR69 TaxID=1796942 RepID=UPI0021C76EC9|nr:LLM class flavin-dependent oxidoreductase [Streptomyces sp. STR69]
MTGRSPESAAPQFPECDAPAARVPWRLWTVCPSHGTAFAGAHPADGADYLRILDEHCAWAERLGADAMLVYDFWQALDPWTAAQEVLARSRTLEPVVAVTAAMSRPAAVARRVSSLSYLHGRPVHLNIVAGARGAELGLLGADATPSAERQRRSAEFAACVRAVLSGRPHRSAWYDVRAPSPGPLPGRQPRIYAPVSTSPGFDTLAPLLDAGLVMAKPYAQLARETERLRQQGGTGDVALIVGIVARGTSRQAREAAVARYGGSRGDALLRRLFTDGLTSTQHRTTLDLAGEADWHDDCLWYGAGRVGIDTPKLVGSYGEVAGALLRLAELGMTTLVVDLPADVAEYGHVARALEAAQRTGKRRGVDLNGLPLPG